MISLDFRMVVLVCVLDLQRVVFLCVLVFRWQKVGESICVFILVFRDEVDDGFGYGLGGDTGLVVGSCRTVGGDLEGYTCGEDLMTGK